MAVLQASVGPQHFALENISCKKENANYLNKMFPYEGIILWLEKPGRTNAV
jgi:hypothetical protein